MAVEEWLTALAGSPWALPVLFVVVAADAFLVVVPGETAVTALGALAVSTGAVPLAAVIAVGAAAAFVGDACCYAVGRTVGLSRWAWMRHRRVQAVFGWARAQLGSRTAVVVFTARFIPFARLAVNLVAGSVRLPAPRYLGIAAVAALGWSAYQAIIGAIVGSLLPDAPIVAVIVSIAVAILFGAVLDAVASRVTARTREGSPDG